MTADGALWVDEQRVASDDALLSAAQTARDSVADRRALIFADSGVSHGRVIRVLELLKQAQIMKIGFGVTQSLETRACRRTPERPRARPRPR